MANSNTFVDTNNVANETISVESKSTDELKKEESSDSFIDNNKENQQIKDEFVEVKQVNVDEAGQKSEIPNESALTVFEKQPVSHKNISNKNNYFYKSKKYKRAKNFKTPKVPNTSKPSKQIAQQDSSRPININNEDKLVLNDGVSADKPINLGEDKKGKDPSFITVLFSLTFVLSLIMIVFWYLNKYRIISPTGTIDLSGNSKKDDKFNLITATTLGQGRTIHLIEIKGKQLVLGSTANNINLLTEFEQKNNTNSGIEEQNIKDEVKKSSIFLDPRLYAIQYTDIYEDYIKDDVCVNN